MESSADVRKALAALLAEQLTPKPYPFPYPLVDGAEVKIGVKLLTDQEIDHARLEAQRYAAKSKADLLADPDFLEREVQRQLVWRSIVEPFPTSEKTYPRLFASDNDVRALPSTVIEALFRLYLEHQDNVSPMRALNDEQVSEMAEAIVKGGAESLSRVEYQSLVRVTLAIARIAKGSNAER